MEKKVEINSFEYEFLKQSVVLIELARKNDRSLKDMIKEFCDVREEVK
jgi:hypothetical protein